MFDDAALIEMVPIKPPVCQTCGRPATRTITVSFFGSKRPQFIGHYCFPHAVVKQFGLIRTLQKLQNVRRGTEAPEK
jgi:hypothetical protein